jgi:hypothetical protein
LRRLLSIAIFVLLSVFYIGAQEVFKPRSYLGIIQGVNFSRVDFQTAGIYQTFRTGYSGGIFFRYVSEPIAGIQIELNYTEKGWLADFGSSEYYNGRLTYVEMPFMTHITLGKRKLFFILNLGPYISYMLTGEIETNSDYPTGIDNRFGFGYCGATGIGFHTGIGTFQFEGRYLNSLTNFFNTSTTTEFYASRNQVINISLVYMIKL